MKVKELVCVNCPMGCRVQVTMQENEVLSVCGNSCPRGEEYARQEAVRPMRVLTSTVRIEGAAHRVLPVITDQAVPLDMIFACMAEVRKAKVAAPVKEGDVIIDDLCRTGAKLLASRSMDKETDASE